MTTKRSRRPPPSIPPTAFDPMTATGRPKLPGPAFPPGSLELAFETQPVRKVATLQTRFEDKDVTDALQAWVRVRFGRSLTQWELYSFILAAALSNESSLFAGALEAISARAGSSDSDGSGASSGLSR